MKRLTFLIVITFAYFRLSAQTVEGVWKTIDDETGKAESYVQTFVKDGKLYGTVIKILNLKKDNPDPICEDCSGKWKDKKLQGMTIIEGLSKKGNKWEGDDLIYYPAHDRSYDCKIWLDKKDKNVLYVRGSYGFIGRTQRWERKK